MKLESNEREKIGSLHWLGSSIDHSTCSLVFSLLVFGYLRFSGLDCVQYLLEDLIASGPAKKFCAGHPSPVASTQLNCSKDFKLFKVLFASYLPALVSHPLPVDLSFARAWAAQLSPEAPAPVQGLWLLQHKLSTQTLGIVAPCFLHKALPSLICLIPASFPPFIISRLLFSSLAGSPPISSLPYLALLLPSQPETKVIATIFLQEGHFTQLRLAFPKKSQFCFSFIATIQLLSCGKKKRASRSTRSTAITSSLRLRRLRNPKSRVFVTLPRSSRHGAHGFPSELQQPLQL